MWSQASSDRTVLNWYHGLQHSNFSVEDAARSGHPRTAVKEETIDAVRAIIDDDPHSTYEQIETLWALLRYRSVQLFIIF
ncbi:unnamed protein product [Didymodactylos carnosus]|uniref:Uncharacterized protein n=1 Tax=Didymodactylos carnosus TaxID=1234261 RepID=A0A8S3A887_9BILA|nr:unnamed protein product [Didymodactylos carnosus]CAF4410997.1 unnamed protein product [Didymodactylos carnosus]CAF4692796.1 unnamed protein product [Didymodactylos carnosus]